MKNIVIIGGAALLVVATAVVWLVTSPTPGPVNLDDGERDLVAGRQIYGEYCAACHGADLEGQPDWQTERPDGTYPAPPHDKTGHTWHHDDTMLFAYTKLGGADALSKAGVSGFKSAMPGFGDRLTDEQIRDVLAYIVSTWPERIRAKRTPDS